MPPKNKYEGIYKKVNKIKTYKTIFGYETWTLSEIDKCTLNTWKIKIFGAVQERGVWRIRTNQELKELYKTTDLVGDIRRKRLEWDGHVLRIVQERAARTILGERPEGRRKFGRQKQMAG
ncbi:hypothetical protein C0J52_04860 [Blattella germanica]|nr:hypothetical protein C0J52_04860 [Blattella germanica]